MPKLSDFMLAARDRESTDNYASQDSGTSFYGAYQFGADAFITTGYTVAGSQEIVQQFNSNGEPYLVWTGQAEWTGKDGINSVEDWLATSNPDITDIQDRAFLEWIYYQWSKIRGIDAEPLAAQTLNGIDLSVSGMVMASHLIGETRFRENFISSGGTDLNVDGKGTSVVEYLELFAGYDLSDLTGISNTVIPDTSGGVIKVGRPFDGLPDPEPPRTKSLVTIHGP